LALNRRPAPVLAMASYPIFDPNQLATFQRTELNKVRQAGCFADPNQPLNYKAINATFPPGSTRFQDRGPTPTAFSTGKYTADTRVLRNRPTSSLPQTTNQP